MSKHETESAHAQRRVCAFLTMRDLSDYCVYDHLLHAPLAAKGWSVTEVPWDQENVSWRDFDAVIIRSPWDYQKAPDRFLQTLHDIDEQTRLFNSAKICQWNLNKRYLRELSAKGVTIIPTLWPESLTEPFLVAAFEELNCQRLVAKPLVGAGADNTFVLWREDPASWQVALKTYAHEALMLQPFIQSIVSTGEFSLFYFDGQFSHAIRKVPAQGDFRVQEEHGGRISKVMPNAAQLAMAQRCLDAIDERLLYARIDLVSLDDDQLALIELELIEPSLYFDQCETSPELFARQFEQMFQSL